jgi:hypothetical protein
LKIIEEVARFSTDMFLKLVDYSAGCGGWKGLKDKQNMLIRL